jgi:hypothetical protein
VQLVPLHAFIPMKTTQYLRIVRASAAYDLLVTWPLATPWTFALLHAWLLAASAGLGLPGAFPQIDPLHLLLAPLMGSVVVVWSLARWFAPSVLLGRLDAVSRALFAAWQIYAVSQGLSVIVLAFTVMELVFLLLQCLPVDDSTNGEKA